MRSPVRRESSQPHWPAAPPGGRGPHVRATVAALLAALLASCTPALPREEVRRATAAYDATAAAAAPIFDEVALADRRAAATAAAFAAPEEDVLTEGELRVVLTFDPANASSLATIGEPVSVARQRRGLEVVGQYFEVLTVLAEGRNIGEAKIQLQVLAGGIAGLAALTMGGAAIPLTAAVAALGPIVDEAARVQNSEELRRLVLEGADKVDALIAALQGSSGAMFKVLKAEPEAAAEGPLRENPAARRTELERIKGYQVALANYVVLLDQLRATLHALVAAVRAPGSAVSLASLSAASSNLLIQAEAARRAYAIVRRPGPANGVTGGTP